MTREQILFTINVLSAFSKVAMQSKAISRGQARQESEYSRDVIVTLNEMLADAE